MLISQFLRLAQQVSKIRSRHVISRYHDGAAVFLADAKE